MRNEQLPTFVSKDTVEAAVVVIRWWMMRNRIDDKYRAFRDAAPKAANGLFESDLTNFFNGKLSFQQTSTARHPILKTLKDVVKFVQGDRNVGKRPEYINEAIRIVLEDRYLDSLDPTAPSTRNRSADHLAAAHAEILDELIPAFSSLVANWPTGGSRRTLQAVNALRGKTFKVMRWAAPSGTKGIEERAVQAFITFQHFEKDRRVHGFARFMLHYRPEIAGSSDFDKSPMRISNGLVIPIENHFYLFGQECTEIITDAGTSLIGRSGYPLIVACALPSRATGRFNGIVLRQTDRDNKVISARSLFLPMGDTPLGTHRWNNAGLYREDSEEFRRSFSQEEQMLLHGLRNVEPVYSVDKSSAKFALTLHNDT